MAESRSANQRDRAPTSTGLGAPTRGGGLRAEARRNYEEALGLYRALAINSPGIYRASLAWTLTNLGMLHAEQKRIGQARANYAEALAIYRELAAGAPTTSLPLVQRVERKLLDLDPVRR